MQILPPLTPKLLSQHSWILLLHSVYYPGLSLLSSLTCLIYTERYIQIKWVHSRHQLEWEVPHCWRLRVGSCYRNCRQEAYFFHMYYVCVLITPVTFHVLLILNEFRLYGMKLEKISSKGRRFFWIWSRSALRFTEEKLIGPIYPELVCIRKWPRQRLNLLTFFCPLVNDLYLDGYLFLSIICSWWLNNHN